MLEPDKQKEQLVELMKAFPFQRTYNVPVQDGDTLQSIAEELKSKPEWIKSANGVTDDDLLIVEGSYLFLR